MAMTPEFLRLEQEIQSSKTKVNEKWWMGMKVKSTATIDRDPKLTLTEVETNRDTVRWITEITSTEIRSEASKPKIYQTFTDVVNWHRDHPEQDVIQAKQIINPEYMAFDPEKL